MKAPPALLSDIQCALIATGCSIINMLAGFNTPLFNLGLLYGICGVFLIRYLSYHRNERKSTMSNIYPSIAGTILPLLTTGILFLLHSEAINFCAGIFLGIAFYNGLYLGLNRAP